MPATFPVLQLKSGRERSVIRRHPWVFSGAVARMPSCNAGDVVEVRDHAGALLGTGFYDPSSQITCRIFHFSATPWNEEGFWEEKFRNALSMRSILFRPEETTGYRLVHAEGDGLPGIIVDVYGNAASVQLRIPGTLRLKERICRFLDASGFAHIYVSEARGKDDEEKSWWKGGEEISRFLENGLQFTTSLETGQKTGYFLDQRLNRAWVRQYSKGRDVLDLFSYAGGFSVHAWAGGAERVTSVDISSKACALALDNVKLNFPDANHTATEADCFDFLKQMPDHAYDLIVLDPPAFTKHISTVEKASRGYKEINLKALKKIRPGGLLFTFSCSQHISPDLFRKIVFGAATDARRPVQILHQLSQAPDHPIDIFHPEGEYLKGLALRVS